MKLRMNKKDAKYFVIFAIAVLYLVAICVANLYSYIEEDIWVGFNAISAFSGEYLTVTILLYVIVMAMCFNGVKNTIFNKEKGKIGITFEQKEETGYSKWADKKSMQKSLTKIYSDEEKITGAGIPIISEHEEVWVDNGESHSLIIGATGSGKTRRIVDPLIKLLAKNNESIILTDPKGELYEENGRLLESLGYQIIVLNFRDPIKGNAWNPLRLPYDLYLDGNQDKSIELLDDLAKNIIGEENKSDPFWENSAADYFTGLSLGLFEDASVDQVNLNSLNLISTVGEDRIGPNSNYIKEYFSTKDPSKPAHINASTTINSPADTKGGILSVFRQKIKLFSSRENLSEMLSHSDFELKSIGAKKTAVFIIIQDEKKTLHPLATIFIKQCYETLIDYAQTQGGKLPVRTNFILDEFANMPALKDVTTMVTAARSRQIRFDFIIQNFAQLYQVYGKENGETIKGNCTNLIYLLTTELAALEEISKLCGEKKVKGKDGKPDSVEPLVTVSDLQKLKMGETIIKRHRNDPFKVKLPDKSEYDFGFKEMAKADYPVRDRIEIGLFDIKEFVKNMKENNQNDIMNQIMNPSLKSNQPAKPTNLFQTNPNLFNPNMAEQLDGLDEEEVLKEMIKRIDDEIAMIEKEEAELKEKELNNTSKSINIDEINDVKVADIINKSDVKMAIDNNEVSDDQFFDDFFMDD